MKKLLSVFLVLIFVVSALASCADEPKDPTTVRLGGMTGPTSIGMAHLLSENAAGKTQNKYEFTLAGTGQDIRTKLTQGELDIAAIPANLAATLYKATNGEIQVLAINTLGVVSLLTKDEGIKTLSDLRGKTVYAPASAKGAIPEIVFSYLLSEAGLTLGTDVQIEWLATAPGGTNPLAPMLKTGEIVLSPEPAATALLSNVEGARRAISLDAAWHALENGSEYITGVTVVRREFAEKNPDAVAKFLSEYEASIAFANAEPVATAEKVVSFGILEQQAPLIARAIPDCNIAFLAGEDMKSALSTYFSLLLPIMPSAFGGTAPDDGFYYIK